MRFSFSSRPAASPPPNRPAPTGWSRAWKRLRRVVIAFGVVLAIIVAIRGWNATLEGLPSGDTLRTMVTAPHAIAMRDARGKTALKCFCPLPARYEDLPRHLVEAVIAIEDRRFRDHPGVDARGLGRAVVQFFRSGLRVTQGGSSIEQQLAKLKLLDARERWMRKPYEIALALRIGKALSKDETIAAYLNAAWFAENVIGVEAAARSFFGKRVQDLDLMESAILAGMLKAPDTYHPQRHPDASQARAKLVLEQMVRQGRASAKQIAQAQRAKRSVGTEVLDFDPRWYLDAVRDELRNKQVVLAKGKPVRLYLALDPWQQRWAQARLEQSGDAYLGAAVAMEPDGRLRAVVGGADFARDQHNNATKGERQVASLAKVIVLAAALESGWGLNDRIDDRPLASGEPRNADGRYHGSVTLREAFASSYNAAMVQLLREVGSERVLTLLRRLGAGEGVPPDMGLALGTYDLPLLRLTGLVATFANGGLRTSPTTILSATDQRGKMLAWAARTEAPRVVSKRTAEQIVAAMGSVVQNGTGRDARLKDAQAFGKTGTSQGGRDGWFIGFTRGGVVSGHWAGTGPDTARKAVSGPREAARDFRALQTQVVAAQARAKHRRTPDQPRPGKERRGPAMAELPDRGQRSLAR